MSDLRQSPQYADYLKSIGWKIEKVDSVYIYLKKLPILGWFAKIQRPAILTNKIINYVQDKYHPFQFSVEPEKQITNLKTFKSSETPSLPTKTLVINLNQSEKKLLNSFSQKTRYNIKISQTKNIEIVQSNDILKFTSFWRKTFEKKRFPFFSQQKNIIALQKAFNKNSCVLLATKNEKTISALFVLIHNKTAYYMYAASTDEGRTNFAPTLLTWNALLLAKKIGCITFDFDGIYDSRFPINSWRGFTKFKSGFSNNEVEYPGNFVKTRGIFKI